MIFNHLILSLLLPHCSLNISYPQLEHLIVKSLGFWILIIFESFNIKINTVLRLYKFHIPSTQIHVGFFLNDICFFEQNLTILFFDINIRHGHFFVKIFDFVLYLKDILLILLFFFEPSHHKISQFFFKIFSLFLLSFQSCFSFGNQLLQRKYIILKSAFIGRSCS